MSFIFDGEIFSAGSLPVSPGNRSLRYGDGLFETMQVREGHILFHAYHVERLLQGMRLLQLATDIHFPRELEQQIIRLCEINSCVSLARIRINVFRNEGDLFDAAPSSFHYLVEAIALSEECSIFGDKGLAVGIFPHARKSCDLFSNLKSNNYLPYLMAARYACLQGWDEALLLNSSGRVAESTIANIFAIKNDMIYTPPLSEGCVAGVMRRYLLNVLPANGFRVKEQTLSPEEIWQSDELFLTNVIRWIRPVDHMEDKKYSDQRTREVYALIKKALC